MSGSIAFLRKLLDAGMPLDMALTAAEAFEEEVTCKLEQRRAKDRERKRRISTVSAESDESAESEEGEETPLLDKEKSPGPPKKINPTPEPPSLPDREQARQDLRRMAIEAKEAAGDALASMAICPGIATIAPLVSLLKAEPPCDWNDDVLPGIEQAAAWHRSRDGPGTMTSWTLAARKAVENRNRRLNPPPPPVSLADVRPSARTPASRRQTDFVDRLSRIDAAMEAAVEPIAGGRGD